MMSTVASGAPALARMPLVPAVWSRRPTTGVTESRKQLALAPHVPETAPAEARQNEKVHDACFVPHMERAGHPKSTRRGGEKASERDCPTQEHHHAHTALI